MGLVLLTAGFAIGCSDYEVSSEDKTAYDKRIRKELADGRRRKARMIAENRRVLDALPRIPGAKRLSEFQNPEGGDEDLGRRTSDETEFHIYASEKLGFPAYAEMTSTGWGTFREYANPRGATARDVYTYFDAAMRRGWRPGGYAAGGSAQRPVYGLSFWQRGRCVWFHIGSPTSAEYRKEVPPGRSYEIATDLRGREECANAGRF